MSKQGEGETEKSDAFKLIKAKIERMWQIASSDGCAKHRGSVADLSREITRLFTTLY
jgi:hypothetical protein